MRVITGFQRVLDLRLFDKSDREGEAPTLSAREPLAKLIASPGVLARLHAGRNKQSVDRGVDL